MSVICDTSKLKLYRDMNKGMCIIYVRKLKNRNGQEVKFGVTRDMGMSDEEVFTMFFERLEEGGFRQHRKTGGGTLRQNANGDYYLEYGNQPCDAPEASGSKSAKTDGKTLFDPHAPEVKALVGAPVIGSTTYVFNEGTCVAGVLDKVNGMFHVRTADGIVQCPFIRVRKPDPINLNDASVRRSLLGRVLVSKDGKHELMVTSMVRDGITWKANGLTSSQLMNNYLYEDGSEISASA